MRWALTKDRLVMDVAAAQQLAALPEATREAIAQREVTPSQAGREIKAKDVT